MLSKRKRQAMAELGQVDPNVVGEPALSELWTDAAPPPKAARYVLVWFCVGFVVAE